VEILLMIGESLVDEATAESFFDEPPRKSNARAIDARFRPSLRLIAARARVQSSTVPPSR